MDQRSGRPRGKRIKVGTIELLSPLKREIYPDFWLRHFYEHVTEKHGLKVSYVSVDGPRWSASVLTEIDCKHLSGVANYGAA